MPMLTRISHAQARQRTRGLPLLAVLGERIETPAERKLSLEGPGAVWLVERGHLDVFAVARDNGHQRGRLHFLARLPEGAILLGAPPGPAHTLVARPLPGAVVRHIPLGSLLIAQREVWVQNRVAEQLTSEERALAWGIDVGVAAIAEALRDELPPRDFVHLEAARGVELAPGDRARSIDGVLWVRVIGGAVAPSGLAEPLQAGDSIAMSERDWLDSADGAVVLARSTADLLGAGQLWDLLVGHNQRFLHAIDRRIVTRGQQVAAELAARRQADADTLAHASRTLKAVLEPALAGLPEVIDRDRWLAVARLVGDAEDIEVTAPRGADAADTMLDPLERIALASRFRTRMIRLDPDARWWRTNVGAIAGTIREGGAPVALLWRRRGYQVVDPEAGTRTRVTRAVAEQLQPAGTTFYRPLPVRPSKPFEVLRFALRGSGRDTAHLVLGGLVVALLGLLVPLSTGKVLGVFVPRAESDLVVQFCVVVLIAAAVSAAFQVFENLAVLRIEGRVGGTLQAAIWDRLLRLPARFFAKNAPGELADAALGISGIREVLSGMTALAIHSAIVAAVNSALLFVYSVPLGLVAWLILVANEAVCLLLGLSQVRWQRRLKEVDHRLSSKLFQVFNGLAKLRVAAAEDFAFAYWAEDFARARGYALRARYLQNAVTVFNAAFTLAATLLLFALVAGPARGSISRPDFLGFNAAFAVLCASIMQFTNAVTVAVAVVPMLEGVKPVLDGVPEVLPVQQPPGDLSGDIEVNHVSFGYAEDGPLVLDDVSFQVQSGEFLAVVGPTGCGKSSLVRLLIGLDQPTKGSILYDGQDLSSLDITAVRRQCGVVLQSGQLFAGSIMHNLCGLGTFTLDDAWEAAEMAAIDRAIGDMPMGMHTVLSEGAHALSAGQRQRLMIARALITRPRILLFDEATSALDNETQEVVTESMRRLRATRIVIAHRLSTIRHADRVLVMEHGRIVQFGSPEELLEDTDGLYYRLIRRQMQ